MRHSWNDIARSTRNFNIYYSYTTPSIKSAGPLEQPAVDIPTLSQWGLFIFGLLTLNLGVGFLRKKEEVLIS